MAKEISKEEMDKLPNKLTIAFCFFLTKIQSYI